MFEKVKSCGVLGTAGNLMSKRGNLGGARREDARENTRPVLNQDRPLCSDGADSEGKTLEKGPYAAETYSASVDEKYVVVEIP